MLIAPHPDDESLACSVVLQRAARVGAAIRVVYATDGEDNPWPQRVLERRWRLTSADRERWGKLRRAEALAALHVLSVRASEAQFLGFPDQKLTGLLRCDCRPILARFAAIISDFNPTHLFVPSVADTHPDHNALAVILRLALINLMPQRPEMSVRSYVVHGKSVAFFDQAAAVAQSKIETTRKLLAIRCHQTQIRLSRRRFLGYASRPERFLELQASQTSTAEASVESFSRETDWLRIHLRFSPKATSIAEPTLFIFGHNDIGPCCLALRPCARISRVEALDCTTHKCVTVARYQGNSFTGEINIPGDVFSLAHPVFIKLERRSWFFDEAGWIEIAPVDVPEEIVAPNHEFVALPA